MRASRQVGGRRSAVGGRNSKDREIHISGAEGLYELSETDRIAREYFTRAMEHPKGAPDKVIITIERIRQKPLVVPLLSVSTIRCGSTREASSVVAELLSASGVSDKTIRRGIGVVTAKAAMHGAALTSCVSAVRVEPDRQRGVRVSRLGIERDSERRLSRWLARGGINTSTVREAIVLASKVASCKDVAAELCVSDDPDYTTGYVASKELGYVRITNIKKKGSPSGGRVFFVKEGADVERVIGYLEKRPVIVGHRGKMAGESTPTRRPITFPMEIN